MICPRTLPTPFANPPTVSPHSFLLFRFPKGLFFLLRYLQKHYRRLTPAIVFFKSHHTRKIFSSCYWCSFISHALFLMQLLIASFPSHLVCQSCNHYYHFRKEFVMMNGCHLDKGLRMFSCFMSCLTMCQ